jgi:hypothetical protein
MAEQSYQEIAEMVRMSDKFELLTMADVEKILSWIGDPNIPDGLKVWYFTSGGNLKEYPRAHLSISTNPPRGIRVVFEKWTDGWSPYGIVDSYYTNPEQIRRLMVRILKRAKKIMDARTKRLERDREKWDSIIANF